MTANTDTSAHGRVFYPGPRIVVGSAGIWTTKAYYPVRELLIEDPRYFYGYPAVLVALFCGSVELLLALGIAALAGPVLVPLGVAGALAAAGLAAAILFDSRRNPRRMELTAWYQGRRVVLFVSTDQRVFGQVRRAVVRAAEAAPRSPG